MSEIRHVDELTLMRLADRELSSERTQTTRSHLLGCASCQSAYEALKAEAELLRAAVSEHEEALPQHIRPRREDVSWLLVAMVAFGTLAVATLWTRTLQPMVEGMETMGLDGTSVITSFLIQSVLWKGWSDMLTKFIEGGILLILVIVSGYAVHWAWRRFHSPAAMLFALFTVGTEAWLFPAEVRAAVLELDVETYRLRSGDSIDSDLIVGGRRVVIEGTIEGDLIVAARTVEVRGEVRGDVLGFAETIEITGTVGGNVRAFAQFIEIEGEVARNVTACAESVRLRPGAGLGGSFTAFSQETILGAPVERDLLIASETSEIQARVGGSALLFGRRLLIGPEGAVSGKIRFKGVEEPEVSPEAELAFPIDFERVEKEERGTIVSRVASFLCFWAAAFILGAAIMFMAPEASETIVTRHVPSYGKSFLAGTIAILVVPVFSLLACLTMVGIPLGLTTCFVLGIGLYVAQAFVGAYIGREILGTPKSATQTMGRLALGLLLIHVAKALPFIGPVATLAVALWGLGALTLFVLERFSHTTEVAEVSA